MTKIEMINEIKNVVMNNGMIRLGWVTFFIVNGDVVRILHGYEKKVKYETVPQIQIYLDCIKDYVAKNAKTVETEVENDTEYVAEPKATKKDIIMGLHKNGEVKCELATAEAIATEGFIIIDRYEDGVLYGEIDYEAVAYAFLLDMDWNNILIDFCKRWDNKLNEAA